MSTYRPYDKNNGTILGPSILGVLDEVLLTGVSVTSGSNLITVDSTTGLFPFMGLCVPNIPMGAFIRAIKNATTIIASVPVLDVTAGTWSIADANATATAASMLGKAHGHNETAIPMPISDGETYRNKVGNSQTQMKITGVNAPPTLTPVDAAIALQQTAVVAKNGDVDATWFSDGLSLVAHNGYETRVDDETAGVPHRSVVRWVSFYFFVHALGAITKIPATADIIIAKTD